MSNPIKFALCGSLTFAIVSTIFNYILSHEFTFSGIFGGLAWFITAVIINYRKKKAS